MVAVVVNGRLMDWNFKRVSHNMGLKIDNRKGQDLTNFPIEKVRVQIVLPTIFFSVAFSIIYGWLLHFEVHAAGPIVVLFFLGISFTGGFNVLATLLVDMFMTQASAATAALNIARCLMGAAGVALIEKMIDGMGLGWCFTFIGLLIGAMTPLLFVLQHFGPRWREERRIRYANKDAKRQAKVDEAAGGEEGTKK